MSKKQRDFAVEVLQHEDRIFVLTALSFVNLGDEEINFLVYRYMRKNTKEDTADHFQCSVNHVYDVLTAALEKCYKVWHKLVYVQTVMNAAP